MLQKIENTKDLAKLLKNRREELGISQKELAKLCNLSHNGISKLERNEREAKLSTLLKLGKFLGLEFVVKIEE